jgi:hypothetical protein
MRRGLAAAGLALTAVAGLALGGCGGSGKSTTTATTATTRTVTVAATTTATTTAPQTTVPGTGSILPSTDSATASESTAFLPFAANSPWNTPISSLPVDPQSDTKMQQARERVNINADGTTRLVAHNDGLFINLHKWTDPVVDETNGVTTRLVCRQPPLLPPLHDYCGDGWSVSTLLIPPDVDPHPEYDGWFTVLNRQQSVAYDLWRARRSTDGSTISYQFMRKWNLNGAGFLVPNTVSARGSGLPLFGGLIWPDEISSGRISHALAMSVPGPAQGSYVQPASATDGIGRRTSLPEGARIRLKAGVTLASIVGRYSNPSCDDPLFGLRTNRRAALCKKYAFPSRTNRRAANAIIVALRRYGAIIVDRSRVPTLYGKFNANWNGVLRGANGKLLDSNGAPFPQSSSTVVHHGTPLLRGNEVQGLRLTDFEVVRLPPSHQFPELSSVSATPVPLNGVAPQTIVPAPRRTTPAPRTTTRGQQRFQPGASGG